MAQTQPLKIGDVVQLKSGGPLMTIEKFGTYATCIWFEGFSRREGLFTVEVLKPANPDETGIGIA